MSNSEIVLPPVEQIYQNQLILMRRIHSLEEQVRNLQVELLASRKPNIFQELFLNTRKVNSIPKPQVIKG